MGHCFFQYSGGPDRHPQKRRSETAASQASPRLQGLLEDLAAVGTSQLASGTAKASQNAWTGLAWLKITLNEST